LIQPFLMLWFLMLKLLITIIPNFLAHPISSNTYLLIQWLAKKPKLHSWHCPIILFGTRNDPRLWPRWQPHHHHHDVGHRRAAFAFLDFHCRPYDFWSCCRWEPFRFPLSADFGFAFGLKEAITRIYSGGSRSYELQSFLPQCLSIPVALQMSMVGYALWLQLLFSMAACRSHNLLQQI